MNILYIVLSVKGLPYIGELALKGLTSIEELAFFLRSFGIKEKKIRVSKTNFGIHKNGRYIFPGNALKLHV